MCSLLPLDFAGRFRLHLHQRRQREPLNICGRQPTRLAFACLSGGISLGDALVEPSVNLILDPRDSGLA
jgi:hypothetical protein